LKRSLEGILENLPDTFVMKSPHRKRRICFVTGTRAEFGLMRSTLEAMRRHPHLQLQLVVTGMHLHAKHGNSVIELRREGWTIDAVVPWPPAESKPSSHAQRTGVAMAQLARTFDRLQSDIVLVVGDRVEAFAAAAAGQVSQRMVAHVHGGDRAAGQIDDSLRHAITKMSHIHFAATSDGAERIFKLGEDRFRIHQVGSPGTDGIRRAAKPRAFLMETFPNLQRRRFALIVLHPVDPSETLERKNSEMLLSALRRAGIEQSVVIYPNNDPGSAGIIKAWKARRQEITYLLKNAPRDQFLGLLRDCAVLIGNSSSGIIEAASFGTPVVDIGPRQLGRLRSQNVTNVPFRQADVRGAIAKAWNNGNPRRFTGRNVYGTDGAGRRIARILADIPFNTRQIRKVIRY
jgi:UDP-N-acetylglucosamine 2-epimerase (non-hydrolysing)/GDP/UDP-N,N'-diacetylbacillosamine 2-epimerase (hydrolysing)